MDFANNYFLLFHGFSFKNIDKKSSFNTFINKDKIYILGLILCSNKKNFQNFSKLPSYREFFNLLSIDFPNNIDELNNFQNTVLFFIINNFSKKNLNILLECFLFLKKENIISNENYKKLISLFDTIKLNLDSLKPIELEKNININENKIFNFKKIKKEYNEIILNLKDISSNEDIKSEFSNINNYLNNQKFSIGITGVMNAGKSTMLNALLGEEILGSSVVPETANLTIIKHGQNERAKVFYWNKKEWDKISSSATILESMKDFIEETNKTFKNNLDSYIQEESKFEEIDTKDLKFFTSAQHSNKKCNLVKFVELKSTLPFLQDGIEIVDTPGLDDPVIQREEITKEYINACDMMLHLMNVSQSATKKDIDFIIDTILYQNISKLLIVITRSDMVSKEQLKEVISYTKSSIKKQLKAQNKDNKLDYILKHIQFIPISAKMALLHRTNNKDIALEKGYKLEDTGILKIENYLNKNLFGNNSNKSELIIQNTKNKLLKNISKQIKLYKYNLDLIAKSKDELQKELKQFYIQKEKDLNIYNILKTDISFYKSQIIEYSNSLEEFLKGSFIELQNIIKQRILNDVKYSLEQTNKKPKQTRIQTIATTAIKDGITDIIRDYRYKFIKKAQSINEICEVKYQELNLHLTNKNLIEYFKDDLKNGFLTSSNDILLEHIFKEINLCNKNKLELFEEQLSLTINNNFNNTKNDISDKAKSMTKTLIESFFKILNSPLEDFYQKLQSNEKLLKNQINNTKLDDNKKLELTLEIKEKIKTLEKNVSNIKDLY